MAAISDDADEFDKLLVQIHNKSHVSHWYHILVHPKNIATDKDDTATKTTLKQLNNSSLQLRCNLRTEQYHALLLRRGLINKYGTNGQYRVNVIAWGRLLNKLGITSEEPTQSQPPGARSQQWYIRVGPKQDGYYKRVITQVNAGSYVPPRIRYLHELQLNLKDEVDHYVIDDSSSSSSSSSESEDDESDEEDNNNVSNDKVPPVVPQDIREIDKSMKQVGSVQDANPYSNLTDQQIKYLIGKLVSTQQTREAATSSTAATVTPNTRTESNTQPSTKPKPNSAFTYTKGETDYRTVSIPIHS